MLVGGGMEHHVGAVVLEHTEEHDAVIDVDKCLVAGSVDLRHGVVKMRLVVVEQDEQGRIEPGNLAADLRTDGAAGPRDQDPVTLERPANSLEVGGDRCPAQQVLDARVAGPADGEHSGAAP